MLWKIALFGSILPVFGATNAALVASLAGTAVTDQSKPVAVLEWISDGAVLHTGDNSKIVVILLNGHRFELGPNARATVGAAHLWNMAGPIRELTALPPMPKPAPLRVAAEATPATSFRGGGEIRGLYPRQGMYALPGPGKLSFQAVEGAAAYSIVLEDSDGNAIADRQSAKPEIEVSLEAAKNYSWRVRAMGAAGVIAEAQASFATFSGEQAKARTAFATAVESNPALLAEVDLEDGLLREAIGEFHAALQANPADAAARRRLARAESALAGK